MKTASQMFGATVRRNRLNAQIEAADIERRAAEAEARLDEPLTRREVVAAIETIANELADECASNEAVVDAFARLAAALS